MAPGYPVRIVEIRENTGIGHLEFQVVNVLEFRRRSWKIPDHESIFSVIFPLCAIIKLFISTSLS